MSLNNYTYFGPIIKINEATNWIYQNKVCSNVNCNNSKIRNQLRKKDKFCSECGEVIISSPLFVSLDSINNISTLIDHFKGFEMFEEYIEFPEAKSNVLILTKESIGDHGRYTNSDDFNFFEIKEDFNIKEKIRGFIEEIKQNGLSDLLDESLTRNGYTIVYGLINFGDY